MSCSSLQNPNGPFQHFSRTPGVNRGARGSKTSALLLHIPLDFAPNESIADCAEHDANRAAHSDRLTGGAVGGEASYECQASNGEPP